MYLTSLRGVSLIGCFVCTLIFCGLGLINNGISVFREYRDLRNGIIPKYWGSEWFGRGMLFCFGAVVGIAGYMAEKELGKYAWIMIGFILCVMLQMVVGNIGPWVFWRWGKMSKELAAKRTKQAVSTFILCGGLLLASGIKNVGIEDSRTWPEGTVPVTTAEEVFDVVYEKTSDTYKSGEYQQGWAKLYIYDSRVEGIPFCYRLLISGWEPTIRSFERNPEIFSLLSTAYRRDTLAYWEDDMQILDHETLGAKHAWLVRQDDYFPYRYYLEVDGAAMMIRTGRELDEHWLRVICQRLTTIIQ